MHSIPKKKFNEKQILCSFVGTFTNTIRQKIYDTYKTNSEFDFTVVNNWSPVVDKNKQDSFITKTINSKFALAPRGYGRSSFRFFEIFQLGTIPIYIWDDIEWLPYKNIIDYDAFCISINISEINNLYKILSSINENTYNKMLQEYEKIKKMFELEGMSEFIINNVNS